MLAEGLESPVGIYPAPGDPSRLYVVEQTGRIRILKGGLLLDQPFLDISEGIAFGGERGLLGLAFHPQYAKNGRFFVHYTDVNSDIVVAEYARSQDPDLAAPESQAVMIHQIKTYTYHNGGQLAFGPDRMLYIGLGDGGGGHDPDGNGQNLIHLLGKILRVDVDHGSPYAIPSDNPYASGEEALPEIWALGLRNPWRFSFDPGNGDLYIADVGQDMIEEIDVGHAVHHGGENYGWSLMEGSASQCPDGESCDLSGLELPVYEYTHDEGRSVIGGFVYRGCRMPGLQGTYFFADFLAPFVRSFRLTSGIAAEIRDWTEQLPEIDYPVSFGLDADGELLIVNRGGRIYRLAPIG